MSKRMHIVQKNIKEFEQLDLDKHEIAYSGSMNLTGIRHEKLQLGEKISIKW